MREFPSDRCPIRPDLRDTHKLFAEQFQKEHEVSDSTIEAGGYPFAKTGVPHDELLRKHGFTVDKSIDITKGVIASMESRQGNFQSYLEEVANDENIRNTELIDTALQFMNKDALDSFKKGETSYAYWLAHKG